MRSLIVLLFLLCKASFGGPADEHISSNPLTRLAFGSCAGGLELPQPLWPNISAFEPQVFIWLGDAIYADMYLNGTKIQNQIGSMKDKFDDQKNKVLGYVDFLKTKSLEKVLGTWDDHDFGVNDGGKHFPFKDEAKKYFLEFLDEPKDSVRYSRGGVFASYDFGDAKQGNLVRIILLDVRYFRDDIEPLDSRRSMLGKEQWKWLEGQLVNSPAKVHLIGTGVQFVADDKPVFVNGISTGKIQAETWGLFPHERQRLIDLIAKFKVPGVVFLSGDIHMAEFSVLKCSKVGYPLIDVTSSSLSHSWIVNLENAALFSQKREAPYHGSTKLHEYNFGDALFANVIYRVLFDWLVYHRFRTKPAFGGVNFGAIYFDWDANQLKIEVNTTDNRIYEEIVNLDSLQFSQEYLDTCSEVEKREASLSYNDLSDLEWIFKLFLLVFAVLCILALIVSLFCKACCRRNKKNQGRKMKSD